ncbi:MAG: tetratricopeptide repeat protein [Bacteroidales bacterium]|nr:tetratricopeptide repeat protein [Bacteroidales bacterium]
MDYKYKIFISYRREDAVFKDTVYYILREYIDEDKIFVDTVELNKKPNKWFETIHDALLSSEYILICINNDTFNRESQENKTDWYYKEIKIALQRQKEDNSVHIIPIINVRPNFDETPFPELSPFQDVRYRIKEGNTTFQERLLNILGIEDKKNRNNSSYPTIIKNIVFPHNLVPRFDMLNKVWKSFYDHNCVVVSGIGGSGKTSLAYLYAKEQNFNNVAWVTVNGKIEDAFLEKMAEILFEGEEQERFIQNQNKPVKLAIVKNKLSNIKGKNLLVLDVNTNNETIKQEINTQIYKYLPSDNWKTLVLTRAIVKNKNRFASIEMDRMTGEEAKELFLNNYDGCIKFSDDQLDIIVNELYYHPLLIEQTAIAFSNSQETDADEVLNNIKGNKVKNKRTEEILGGLAIEEKEIQDIYTYLINLCNIENLSTDEVKNLAVYVTWPNEPIANEVIETLLPNSKETIDSLVEKGILSHNDYQFSIHSLMADVIREQINISEFDYANYLNNVNNILWDDYKSVALHSYSKCIASSFINYGICGHIVLFGNFLNNLLNNNDVILYQLPMPKLYHLANEFEKDAEPDDLAGLYNSIAKVEAFKNNLRDAKKHFEKALEVIEGAEENEEILDHKGALLQNLAKLEANLDDTDSAKKHYEEAVEIFRKLPEIPKYLDSLAITLGNFANLEINLDETDSAKKHWQETIEIFKKLPETPDYLDSLSSAINNLALLEKKLGETDSAKTHYEEAVEVNRKLLELTETPKYLDSLAASLSNLAGLEDNLGDTDSAKKHYEEAVEKRRQLPETPEYLDNLTNSLVGLAMVEAKLGDTDSAKKHYEEAVEIKRQLPETPEYLEHLANALAGLAMLERNLGDIDSAKKHLEEGLEISRRSGNEEYIKFFFIQLFC